MKYLDDVKVIKDNDEYKKEGVYLGMVGTIIFAEIRYNSFYVAFNTNNEKSLYKTCCIKIEDLQLVKDNDSSDEIILEDLPKHNPNWWCKVENGYILNLKGERKNKIPHNYDS